MKKLILYILLAIAITGCSKKDNSAPADAVFTTDSLNYYLNEAVFFKNASTNGKSYSWDFGDGSKSTDQGPSHSFTVPGSYNVQLTVNGSAHASKSLKIYRGQASYQVTNLTSYSFPLVSFAVNAQNTIIDFVDHGFIISGGTTGLIYTSDSKIYIGGTFSNGESFIAVYPHSIINFTDNVLALTDTSSIYVGNSINKKQPYSVFLRSDNVVFRKTTLRQMQLFKQTAQ